MIDKNKTQKGGKNSVNIQAENFTYSQSGLSYKDVKEIVLDLFKENFPTLMHGSGEVVKKRIEQMADKYIKQIKERQPENLDSMVDPGMQYAFYNAQKEFARTGDEDLAATLIDLLLDRAAIPNRNLQQILIDESLSIVPKLTIGQLDVLTLVLMIKYISYSEIPNSDKLIGVISNEIVPFIHNLPKGNSLFHHLEYCGCAELPKGLNLQSTVKIEEIFLERYGKIFPEDFNNEKMIEFLCSLGNEMKQFVEIWNTTKIKMISLTTLGIIIANANYRRRIGKGHDLSSLFE